MQTKFSVPKRSGESQDLHLRLALNPQFDRCCAAQEIAHCISALLHHRIMQCSPLHHRRLRVPEALLIPSGFLAPPKSRTTRIAFRMHLRQHSFQIRKLDRSEFRTHRGTSSSFSLLISSTVLVAWLCNIDVDEDGINPVVIPAPCSIGLPTSLGSVW